MKALVLALLLPSLALASNDPPPDVASRLDALSAEIASLRAQLAAQPRRSPGYANAVAALRYPLAMVGLPVFGARITSGGGSFSGSLSTDLTFTDNGEGVVFAGTGVSIKEDGTDDIAFDAEGNWRFTDDGAERFEITGLAANTMAFEFGSAANAGRMDASSSSAVKFTPPATFGFQVATSGAKVLCDVTNAGSLFYENTAGDTNASVLYICAETAVANTYAWATVGLTFP